MVDRVQPYCMGPYTYLLGCLMVWHRSLDVSDGKQDNKKDQIRLTLAQNKSRTLVEG